MWAESLALWTIPDAILAAAPESPWVHPPAMFRDDAEAGPADTPSFRRAAQALDGGGTVLDIGCGGGRSSLPLGSRLIKHATGIDQQRAMLDQFAEAAAQRGIPCALVEGDWPDVSGSVEPCDVVICHHVVYNVAPIEPFVRGLAWRAKRRVVVELPDRHPTSGYNQLWKHFWNLDRPTEPSAELFVEVVRDVGYDPNVETFARPARAVAAPGLEFAAFLRRRLCLTPDRDAEIAAFVGEHPVKSPDTMVTVWFDI